MGKWLERRVQALFRIQTKKIEDMGEEEIRARMDFEKIWITGAFGVIFSIFLGWIWLILDNSGSGYGFKIGGLIFVLSVAIAIMRHWITPAQNHRLELAEELDRRKKST